MIVEVHKGKKVEIIDNISAMFIDETDNTLKLEINRMTGPLTIDRVIELDENTLVQRPDGTILYKDGKEIPPNERSI